VEAWRGWGKAKEYFKRGHGCQRVAVRCQMLENERGKNVGIMKKKEVGGG
jgi:hypothetical protein